MKQLAAPLFAFVCAATAHAQWSTDPAAPLVVCNAANGQSGVQALPDGSGGWFVFWLDKRMDGSTNQVYGQRIDSDGYAQWTANGKAILTPVGETVAEFAATVLDNGNVLLAYVHRPSVYQDTLSAQLLDVDGNALLPQPTHVAQSGSPVLGLGQVRVCANVGGGAMIGWYDTYFGGSNGINCTRIENNGTLPWGPDGYAIPGAAYGPFDIFDDGALGAMVNWRDGNGSGANMHAMHVTNNGTNAWPANVNSSVGSGLNYAFSSVGGPQHAVITAWRNNPGHLEMARLDTSGTLPWGAAPTVLCNYASSQDEPVMCNAGNEFVAAWADNRPPASNADVFVQRFDANGQLLWATDGLPGIQTNTYIPTPGIVAGNNGAVIVTVDGSVMGFCAQRILSNGTQDWAAPTPFCVPSFNPFYDDQVKRPDGAGGVVAFWSNQTDVYAARIFEDGQLGDPTGIAEATRAADLLIAPSLTNGPLSVHVPEGHMVRTAQAVDAQGRATALPITALNGARAQFDASALAPGAYVLQLGTDAGTRTGRFVVAR